MGRVKRSHKTCTVCGVRKHRSDFSPGQGKCRACRWHYRKHILGERTDLGRKYENKRKRVAATEATLQPGEGVCSACEAPFSGPHHQCGSCRRKARERARTPRPRTSRDGSRPRRRASARHKNCASESQRESPGPVAKGVPPSLLASGTPAAPVEGPDEALGGGVSRTPRRARESLPSP